MLCTSNEDTFNSSLTMNINSLWLIYKHMLTFVLFVQLSILVIIEPARLWANTAYNQQGNWQRPRYVKSKNIIKIIILNYFGGQGQRQDKIAGGIHFI